MIDDQSPAGSWQEHIELMQAQGKKSPPVEDCRDAPWHYDDDKVFFRLGRKMHESALQTAIKHEIELRFECEAWAIPNGIHIASHVGRRKASSSGLTAGATDMIIIGERRNAGLVAFAEIKATSRLSWPQYEKLCWLHDNGHRCGVFRSADTLGTKLTEWGWK